MGLARWIVLLGLLGCGSLAGPRQAPEYVAGPAPCPRGTQLRVTRSPELTVAQCETPAHRVHGWRASYWPNGRRGMFGEYRNGRPDGLLTAWHANGVRSLRSRWVDGRREGRSAEWYASGKLSSTVNYAAGVQHGLRLDYYPSGHPMSRASFRDGVQEGQLVAWYPDGVKQLEGSYQRGRAEGRWSYWDPSGALDAVIQWRHGIEVPASTRRPDVAAR